MKQISTVKNEYNIIPVTKLIHSTKGCHCLKYFFFQILQLDFQCQFVAGIKRNNCYKNLFFVDDYKTKSQLFRKINFG
jgi:hypothetical protein